MECPFYGSRQMAGRLRREGSVARRHRVCRLMQRMRWQALPPPALYASFSCRWMSLFAASFVPERVTDPVFIDPANERPKG